MPNPNWAGLTGITQEEQMSTHCTPAHVRWARPVFGLALGLATLFGLMAILHASAAPLASVTTAPPAAFNSGPASPAIPPLVRISPDNASPLTRTAVTYSPPSGRSPAMEGAPASRPAADTPYARANIDWDAVDGWFGPGVTVQYTVTRGEDTIGGGAGSTQPNGWMNGIGCGCDMQPGDHVTVDSSAGFHAELVPIAINGAINVGTDVISGQMFGGISPGNGGNIDVRSKATDEWNSLPITIRSDGTFDVDFTSVVDIQNGDSAEVWYNDANGNQVGIMLYTPYLQVCANRAHNWVEGEATPQTTVYVTVTRGGQVIATGDNFTGGGTGWHINPQQPDGNNVDMRTGDTVNVTAGTLSASLLLIDIDGSVNATTGGVSGRLAGVPFPADVRIEVWSDNPQSKDLKTGDGTFNVIFDAPGIRQGDNVGIWYVRPDGHLVGIVRADFRLETELRSNNIWGTTTPNTRVDLTLLSGVTVKGAATVWSDSEGNFGNRPTTAAGQTADIAAGDIINGSAGDKTATMTIPQPFSASYDHVTDEVCMEASAGTQVQVDLWGYGTQWLTVDGSGNSCATFGGDPGIDAGGEIRVDLPPGHSVLLRFNTLSPNLWLDKRSDGQPPLGGYHRYTLRVGNDEWSDKAASGVVLTDTLPAGMTFVSESTGTATHPGNQVVWNLGTIARGAEREITLTVHVDASAGAELENCAEVMAADWESYRENNTSCDQRGVTENLADLSIGGWTSPGDPAPGAEYIYRIYYNNNQPAGSQNVRITDTLPAGTTYESEWHPDGWTVDMSQPGKVIWLTDYLPGQSGRYLELHLRVDSGATPDATQLHNRVEIAGEAPETDLNNNVWENDAGVKEPYNNVSVGKSYSHGIPVAGYEYTTWVQVWSDGNVPATGAVLTDTLPAGATFVAAFRQDWNPDTGDYDLRTPFPPDAQDTGWVRWNLPVVTNWRNFQVEVTFRIGTGTAANTRLVNRADVAIPGDQDPSNNHAEFDFRTQAPGPNLRVTKWYDWGDVMPGNNVQYQLRFENDGTEPIYDPVFKDILPDQVTLNGFGWEEEPVIEGKTLTWTPNWQLNPGDQHGFWVQVRVNDDTAVGDVLTNTAQALTSTPEVITADNIAQVALAAGPDLRVSKELLDPGLLPGQRARYRIHIWNDGYATARNVVLTDTLPLGLTFAGAGWGGEVQGNQVIWQLGDQGPGWRGEIDLEVDVHADLNRCAKLSNRLEITNSEGDAVPGNNAFQLLSLVQPCWPIQLPLVLRN